MKHIWHIILCFLLVLPAAVQADDLCTNGILLFREDFGGNDPDDPRLSTTPVEGMSYTLSTSGMGSGSYMVTKSGYCNGDTTGWTLPGADLSGKRSQWYIQDDHTYPNDYSRGYFMEIDGNGGNQQFYQTEIYGLCEGVELTFSAYVANVFTWFQYDWYTRNRGPVIAPCLKFVLTDPQTGETLAEKNTQQIPFAEDLAVKTDWQYSSPWYLVGMNFIVPTGIPAIRLTIYNNVTNGNGNDFALDDIEIHLCMTPDTIRTDTTVCDTTSLIRWRNKSYLLADTLRDTLRSTCGFDSIYYVKKIITEPCEEPQPELCIDGILLFREDFGGNDPDDPRVGQTPVQGMTYTQLLTDAWRSMGSGKYIVTKSGYCNGDTSLTNLPQNRSSQWHLQDDHTYPDDRTRGYFMEIDGQAGSAAFYQTTIDHLCKGIELTFSAYVANVMTWGMYMGRPGVYAYPRLLFKLTNPVNNVELASYDTGDIPFDSAFINDYSCWQQSSEWHLVGMNFTVPIGVESIQLSIYNNVSSSTGNDFALDDIEIHLCMTPDTIRTDTTVCDTTSLIRWRNKHYLLADTLRDTLRSTCGFDSIYYVKKIITEPCEEPQPELCTDGTLLFREDFGGNNPTDPGVSMAEVPGMEAPYYNSGNGLGSGHYSLRKEGWHNGIQWHWQDDHTYPDDKTRGYLLEVDGIGGEKAFYTKTIDGLCAGTNLTFSAYVVNVHYAGQLDYFGSSYVYPRMKFVLKNPETGAVLASQSTGDIQPDWRYGTPDTWKYARDNQLSAEWQLIGMNFTVPEGINAIQMFIYNDVAQNGNGNDFALDDIEIHLCAPPVTIDGDAEVCADKPSQLTAHFTNDGTFPEPLEYKWWFSADSLNWTERGGNTSSLAFSDVQQANSGWYKVAVAGSGNINSLNCRAMSEPFLLIVNDCGSTTQTIRSNLTICDTVGQIEWRGKTYPVADELRDTLHDRSGKDSVYYILYVRTVNCCQYNGLHSFSISADKQVLFAPGNLQYNATLGTHLCADGTTQQGSWRFAEHQWDIAEQKLYYHTDMYDGWIDLFAWGTSGWSDGVEEYQPWSETSGIPDVYYINGDATLSMVGEYKNADWAVYNAIGDDAPDTWRTLTADEWNYILDQRKNAALLCGKATVNDIHGLVFLPDDYPLDDSSLPTFIPGKNRFCETNIYTESQWIQLENKGAVFLPAAGVIYGGNINFPNKHGYYWSATANNETGFSRAYDLEFYNGVTYPPTQVKPEDRRGGKSVRPVWDIPEYYVPTIEKDTTVCDTLLPITWRGHEWTEAAVIRDTLQSVCGTDSVCLQLSLHTEPCCPDIVREEEQHSTCDTLMPYVWEGFGARLVFEEAGTQEIDIPHEKWTNCIAYHLTVTLTVAHCQKEYPIIVNKYNWQLLLDYNAFRRYFPDRTATAFQWYKNNEEVAGATEDDYAETQELVGTYQLRITLDGGQEIWSNTIDLSAMPVSDEPVHVRIYNSRGEQVSESQITRGLYLYQFEQGQHTWTEKKIIR